MKKPGDGFGFRPTNNLRASDRLQPGEPHYKGSGFQRGQGQSFDAPIRPPTSAPRQRQTVWRLDMARSRSASFSDDDIEFVGSQMIAEARSQQQPPLPPASGGSDIIDISSSPVATAMQTGTATPEFGKPTMPAAQPPKMFSSLYRKEKKPSVFLQPQRRPEHHRGHLISGPSALKYNDKDAPPLPVYTSLPPVKYEDGSRPAGASLYSQPEVYDDEVFYTDPKKATDDLKALLEGGIEEGDEEGGRAGQEGKIDDGSLEGISVKLLPHQQEGVEWMKGRELGPVKRGKVPKGGILADDMGLGKTLQSIALIISSPKPAKDSPGWKKHYATIGKGTLVVAPLALIRQWEAEIAEKVSPKSRLSVCVHHGPGRTKKYTDLEKYDVVITTYQILVSEHGHSTDSVGAGCFGIHWFRVILDEAHSIKNRNAKATKACCALRAEFRWCLTGTPMQNNLDELQSLVNFLRIAPYNDLKHWREYIDQPMKNGKGHLAIRRLHSILRCFMKRRTKEILKEEGALNPGGKKALEAAAAQGGDQADSAPAFKVTQRKVVAVSTEFSPAERRFYARLEERADESLQRMMKGRVNYANALVLLLRLRQACNHPKLVGVKPDKDKDAISLDTVQPRKADQDIDALADALGTMDIEAKQCDVCMSDLSREEVSKGLSVCGACQGDRAEFETESPQRRRPKKRKGKKKTVVTKSVEEEGKHGARVRRPRNRPAVLDSDDEENDASWIVGEAQRGPLRLGKAGGEEDENAEGGGEWLQSEDSIHHSEDEEGEDSRPDSFIVDDEEGKSRLSAATGSDEDSLLSVSKIRPEVLDRRPVSRDGTEVSSDSESGTVLDSEADSAVSESEQESGDDQWAHKDTSGRVVPSAKIRQLLQILHKEVHEHKFIVFSQFTSMLDLIEPFLAKDGIKYARYDGGMKNDQREESLHALRNDKNTRLLLCSLKCGSLGLNLTAATRVVILEPFWNPFIEEQAIDRVHRLTQTVDVVVYKLTVEKSVEERILELQNKKRLLAEQAIEGGMKKKDALGLGLQEMLALFNRDRTSSGPVDYGADRDPGASATEMEGFARKKNGGSTARPRVDPAFDRRW